ncbi:MAG: helix-turn-helix transcriptional regulator [Flavobacteriaceae bacterium]|nr:helix-turn-helix transcriptional regulator [Flavobacteriaceae bacterium]
MKTLLLFVFISIASYSFGQYQFSGKVNAQLKEGKVYLSTIEDYRKISGVYSEQILNMTLPDSLGNFSFTGDNLPQENKMYRIHLDTCSDEEQSINHFTGHCANSKEVVFIANNTDTLSFPFSFDNEMFCRILSNNDKAELFLKIDSLKHEMRFAFGTYRSEANRSLNTKKWFTILQEYGKTLQEPLAELYIYSFLSDRTNDLHEYYLEDVKVNPYYENLRVRLQEKYPESSYTKQYEAELEADEFLVNRNKGIPWWIYFLGGFALFSVLGNFYFIGKWKQLQKTSKNVETLSKQEQKVMELILEDKSNKEIADALFISVSTVKTHINNIYKKLNISSREELKNLYIS